MNYKLKLLLLVFFIFSQNSFSQQFNLEWEIDGWLFFIGDMDNDGVVLVSL
ncbi:MAG: hypothetical protein ACE5HX_05220 [bacterium]